MLGKEEATRDLVLQSPEEKRQDALVRDKSQSDQRLHCGLPLLLIDCPPKAAQIWSRVLGKEIGAVPCLCGLAQLLDRKYLVCSTDTKNPLMR